MTVVLFAGALLLQSLAFVGIGPRGVAPGTSRTMMRARGGDDLLIEESTDNTSIAAAVEGLVLGFIFPIIGSSTLALIFAVAWFLGAKKEITPQLDKSGAAHDVAVAVENVSSAGGLKAVQLVNFAARKV